MYQNEITSTRTLPSASYYERPAPGHGYTYVKERLPVTKQSAVESNSDDLSSIGSILGAVLCFLLFCVIIFSIAYPFTMSRPSPPDGYMYSDNMWWCYHCTTPSTCAGRCW